MATFRIGKTVKILLLSLMAVLQTACRFTETESEPGGARQFYIELQEDDWVKKAVMMYADRYNLDSKSTVINTYMFLGDTRKVITVNHSILSYAETRDYPLYYTVVEGFLVAVYSGLEEQIKDSPAQEEFESKIKEMGIVLSKDPIIFDPVSWSFIKCNESEKVVKNDGTGLIYNQLPCEFELEYFEKEGTIRVVVDSTYAFPN